MSRKFTEDEIRDRFIAHVWTMIDYQEQKESRTSREKLQGLAFSILAAIDGKAMALPAFELCPSPHPDDKQFHIDEGDDYYPEGDEHVDIAGSLHDRLYRWAEENGRKFRVV